MAGGTVQKQQTRVCLKPREGFGDGQVVIEFQSQKMHVARGLRESIKAGVSCPSRMLAVAG
jgi:hypothetical protein